jgi:tetratricopeptide (TPR) repeat protein
MGAVTYPQAAVREILERATIPIQFDNTVDAAQPVIKRYHHVWTPDLRILTGDGDELYRWNGYLPPAEFAAQLLAALAQARLRLREFDAAIALYEETLKLFPTSICAPEAQYFLAVANYRKSGEASDLLRGWHRLEGRYPLTEWTVKQDFH